MIDLTNAPNGSFWRNQRGDLVELDREHGFSRGGQLIVWIRESTADPSIIGCNIGVNEKTGIVASKTYRQYSISHPEFTECPY